MNRPVKTYPTIGACGLDCGLCPRYYKEILDEIAAKEGVESVKPR